MNDIYDKMNAQVTHFDSIADVRLKEVADERRRYRSERRASALNVVDLARTHAGNASEPYSQSEADVIIAIMELLDRVAEG